MKVSDLCRCRVPVHVYVVVVVVVVGVVVYRRLVHVCVTPWMVVLHYGTNRRGSSVKRTDSLHTCFRPRHEDGPLRADCMHVTVSGAARSVAATWAGRPASMPSDVVGHIGTLDGADALWYMVWLQKRYCGTGAG